MDKINIIIEPHYDDAWLSMGNYILKNKKENFVIISISIDETNNSYNSKLLMQYCPNIVKVFGMNKEDFGWKQREKKDIQTYGEYLDQSLRYLDFWSMQKRFIEKELFIFMKEYNRDGMRVFIPMGIQNPMHVIVSNLMICMVNDIYVYQDVPYAFKKKFDFLIPKIVEENCLELIYENDGSKNEKKFEIFNAVYSKQFFLKESCKSSKEKIYKEGKYGN